MNISIVDYGMGNLRSVEKAFRHVLQEKVVLASEKSDLKNADIIVVPGVGAFDDAVRGLKRRQLFEPIGEWIRSGKPYLGLCLGLQLLFPRSDEGSLEGWGIVPGKVIRFPSFLKTPHMGWNTVTFQQPYMFDELKELTNLEYYFVHSYFVVPLGTDWFFGETENDMRFVAMVGRKNVLATQFHPEKSQRNGLLFIDKSIQYLSQFVKL